MAPPTELCLSKRFNDQVDAHLAVLNRIGDAIENLTLQIVAIENPTFTPVASPGNGPALFPDGSPRPIPKTITRCHSCHAEWTKPHEPRCSISPGGVVSHRDCEEVPVHE